MNVVAWALRRPVTILVLALALLLAAIGCARRCSRDILPQLGVPTIYVAQPYGGMSPAQMEGFLTYYFEYHFLYLTGIEHVESRSIQGTALIKLQFHPGTDMSQAMAETVAYVNRARSFMPPGTLPPFVMRFDAGSVPVGNLVFESDTLPVAAIQDAALNRVRPLFATLPGVSAPPPFGGSARTIVLRLKPERLQALHVSPDEVVNALAANHSISPAGSVYFGDQNPMVPVNSLVSDPRDFSRIPLRVQDGNRVYLGDVASVEDAADVATAFALINGHRTVYIPVTKRADASTLAVVDLVRASLPKFQAVLPSEVKVSYQFDQSVYVRRSLVGLLQEAGLGALLSGLMVLLFLRDLRGALIVVINIPLALGIALVGLYLSGQSLNLMTLGGLALAVGILVDESTVTLESIHAHRSQGKSVARAVLDSGTEIATPLLVSMLCILSVFVPSFLMTGPTRALFAPLSLAVAFAMLASYCLSRSLVPVLCCWLLPNAQKHQPNGRGWQLPAPRKISLFLYAILVVLSLALIFPRLGREIFPQVDQGQLQLRLRTPAGSKLEYTEEVTKAVLDRLAELIGKENVLVSLAFVGTQPSSYPINNIYLWTSGPQEAVAQIQLRTGSVRLEAFKERLRHDLSNSFPGVSFSFEPSDILSRVLSFGSTNPIEVAVSGPDFAADRNFAQLVEQQLRKVSGLRDLQYLQTLDYPTVEVQVDRLRAAELKNSVAGVARSVVDATSSSRFVSPSYWADPKTGIAYNVQVEIARGRLHTMNDLLNLPVENALLRNLARVVPGQAVGEYDRYNMQRTVTLGANYSGTDLGTIATQVQSVLSGLEGQRPPNVSVALRGLIPPLQALQSNLAFGMVAALVVILLLLTANFQSLRAALVVCGAMPAALAGSVLMLFLTGTTLNLQSLMGAIMAVGVGVANAILLVSAALHEQERGAQAWESATRALHQRQRAVLMTALSMGAGMLPMALGLGEGGQQTAPLGRAVLGGLIGATLAVLLVLPALYAVLNPTRSSVSLDPSDPDSRNFEGVR